MIQVPRTVQQRLAPRSLPRRHFVGDPMAQQEMILGYEQMAGSNWSVTKTKWSFNPPLLPGDHVAT